MTASRSAGRLASTLLVLVLATGCGAPSWTTAPEESAPAPLDAGLRLDGGSAADAAPLFVDAGPAVTETPDAGAPTTTPAPRVGASDLEAFYDRLAADLAAGKPLVTTVYVALCDNDSQGIVPVKNRSICNGDDPEQNMYWTGRGGLAGWARRHWWRRETRSGDPDGVVMIEQVWSKRLRPGGALRARGVTSRFTAYVIGRAYRGREIHRAMADYLHAVHHDDPLELAVDDRSIRGGGAGHIVGYQGHDYVMDLEAGEPEVEDLRRQMRGDSRLPKGAFALACAGDRYIRSGITRPNVYVLLLNRYLAFPNAWAIGGLLDGIAAGGDGDAVYVSAAQGFARGQECGLGWALRSFAHGPRPPP